MCVCVCGRNGVGEEGLEWVGQPLFLQSIVFLRVLLWVWLSLCGFECVSGMMCVWVCIGVCGRNCLGEKGSEWVGQP